MICFQDLTSDQALEFWLTGLWKARKTKIEEVSFMKFLGGYHETVGKSATFIGAFCTETSELVGINSFHRCEELVFRSRGLYVSTEWRGRKIGQRLLLQTVDRALKEGCNMLWTFPREESLLVYLSAGFAKASEFIFDPIENKRNCYAVFNK